MKYARYLRCIDYLGKMANSGDRFFNRRFLNALDILELELVQVGTAEFDQRCIQAPYPYDEYCSQTVGGWPSSWIVPINGFTEDTEDDVT